MINEAIAEKAFGENTSRREFLVLSRQLLLSASALTLCPLSLRASDIDPLNLKYLDSSSALLLAQVSRLLFPHNSLADRVYLNVIGDIDADMSSNEKTRMLINRAIVIFNDKADGNWLKSPIIRQLELLRSLQGSELFAYLHTRTIESLYRNPEVWKLIGYQGSSVEYGGYLHRGFDDIDWLDK